MQNAKLIVGLLFFILMGMLIAGCSQDTANEGNNSSSENTSSSSETSSGEASSEETSGGVDLGGQNISITMGPQGGTTYPVGAQIAEHLNSKGANASVTVGGSISNLKLIDKGEAELGHATSDLGYAAASGIDPFADGALENVTAVAKIMDMHFQFAILESSGISSLEEVAEQQYPLKLAVNPPGNISELVTRRVLEQYGITYDKIKEWGGTVQFGSHADNASLIRDGHAEALTLFTSLPAPVITEIDLQNPMKLLTFSDKVNNYMKEEYGYVPMEVPEGVYSAQSESGTTFGGGIVIFANKNLDDQVAYEVAKFISEDGQETLGTIHEKINQYLEGGANAAGVDLGAPLHPGAEKYFKEAGVLE